MNQPIIQATSIFKSFPVKTENVMVLNDVSLEIYPKDFLIIIGPSGCGKSTLLHLLLGLEQPTRGTVSFLGQNLYEHMNEDQRTEFRKKHIGVVFQQPHWLKALSVVENIAFVLRLNNFSKQDAEIRAIEVLKLLNMEKWAGYFPTELSSGQQQKVALARSLAIEPDVIVADEPTGNLDFSSGQELMKLLKDLHNAGKTIVMVTHDLAYLNYSTRSIKMLDGRIVTNGYFPAKYPEEDQLKKSEIYAE